jgi:hypothetical protein
LQVVPYHPRLDYLQYLSDALYSWAKLWLVPTVVPVTVGS